MTSFVVEDRHDGSAVLDECTDDRDFWNGVERSAGVPRQSTRTCQRGEEDNGVAAELDVASKSRLLIVGKLGDCRVEF